MVNPVLTYGQRFKRLFPIRITMLVLLILILTIATNDVKLKFDDTIRDNYWLQIVTVALVTLIIMYQESPSTPWDIRLFASGLIVLLFWLVTAPNEPFSI